MTKDDGFGPNLDALWSWYDRDLCSWRMSQDSLPLTEDTPSETSSVTWPSSGTMRSGRCYPQAMWEPPIYASESGLWPTPAAHDPGFNPATLQPVDKTGQPPSHPNQRWYHPTTGRLVQKGLTQVAKMWPTPSAAKITESGALVDHQGNPWKGIGKPHSASTKRPVQTALTDAVKMWPTPTASDAPHPNMVVKKGRRITKHGKEHSIGLEDSVKMWPTPRSTRRGAIAPDLIQPGGRSVKRRESGQVRGIDLETAVGSGQLNPTWVAWLMGFPTGWLS